jgi:hypothetical protein
MGELLGVPGALGAFGLALLIFGFLPGMVLSLIVRMIPDMDRRRELQAELYEVPRWERPFWVLQQFEVALRVGLFPEIGWLWGRHVWHRCKLESGMESHLRWPDSFEVPSEGAKAELRPGDRAKLMWSVKRMPGERMWVTITHRDGDNLTGTLYNWAVFAYLRPDETVTFHIDDIIDCIFEDEGDEAEQVA